MLPAVTGFPALVDVEQVLVDGGGGIFAERFVARGVRYEETFRTKHRAEKHFAADVFGEGDERVRSRGPGARSCRATITSGGISPKVAKIRSLFSIAGMSSQGPPTMALFGASRTNVAPKSAEPSATARTTAECDPKKRSEENADFTSRPALASSMRGTTKPAAL